MKLHLILLHGLLLVTQFSMGQIKVEELLTENRIDPIGLDERQPRFTWKLSSARRGTMQTAYELRVALDVSTLSRSPLWSTGKINSDSSVLVAYKGPALRSGKQYFWQVRVWDNQGKTSAWSKPGSWQTGMMHQAEWKASWIGPSSEEAGRPSPYLRKEFNSNKGVKRATAFITAHGLYEANINGKRVGDAYLTPGWTSYNKRLQYQVYDVTSLLKQGVNAIGAALGNGWYRGYIGFQGQKDYYGKDIAFLLQLEIEYADGSTQTVISDRSWKWSYAEIGSNDIYNGQTIDARRMRKGWDQAGFAEEGWKAVAVREESKTQLIATYNEPIRKKETFKPLRTITTPMRERVLDFGQNLVGWVIVEASGKAGDSIILSHAEVLDKEGNFYTTNLRSAHSSDTFILSGNGRDRFEPQFTFHGFRYLRIKGNAEKIDSSNITAVALYSDMRPTGSFTSSHALINQLQHNIQWGQKGNFLDVPTDCPQRDERLGWTGDAQVFCRTAAFNMGVHNFFAKWLRDLEADQSASGGVPYVVPTVLNDNAVGSAGWADAATIIPWDLYLAYGDKRLLETQYESMKKWVEFMRGKSKRDLWNTGFHFGDWLFYRPDDDNDGRSAVTDKYLIAQCFYAHSTGLLVKAAEVLGKREDAQQYTKLLENIRSAFRQEYMTPGGRLVSSTQTAYVLALHFDLLPDSLRSRAAEILADNIKSYNNHLTTGFLGTPYLCHVLTRFGHTDLAYRLLFQQTYPSWLYPVKMGATTIWERWDGIKPDGSFQNPGMNSYNHYAYGAIGDWIYRVAAGIDTREEEPGYKKIVIRPRPGGEFDSLDAKLETYYGVVRSAWKKSAGKTIFLVTIPVNTKATIILPAKTGTSITESNKPLDLSLMKWGKEEVMIEAGSGEYIFVVDEGTGR